MSTAGRLVAARFDLLHQGYAAALSDAGTPIDLRSTRSLTHSFAALFPLDGGGALATTELISRLRAYLSRV